MCRLREMQNILAFFGCGTLMLHLNTTEKHRLASKRTFYSRTHRMKLIIFKCHRPTCYRSMVYEEMPTIQLITNTQLLKQQVIRDTLTNFTKTYFQDLSCLSLATVVRQLLSKRFHSISHNVRSSALNFVSPRSQIKSSSSYWFGKCGRFFPSSV